MISNENITLNSSAALLLQLLEIVINFRSKFGFSFNSRRQKRMQITPNEAERLISGKKASLIFPFILPPKWEMDVKWEAGICSVCDQRVVHLAQSISTAVSRMLEIVPT